jgi:RNA polymerase sigma-70 factor (ECF subfamily)
VVTGCGNKPVPEDWKSAHLEYLMKRFGKKVLKLAYYHLRDHHRAEDVAQEVFWQVYLNLDRFREESSYYTWIYRITVNLCKDYLRSAYLRRMLPWSNYAYLESLKMADQRMFEAAEGGEIFRKVMDLPLKYRTVIALYYFEEMSTKEISRILNLRENTVRTRLCRARKILHDLLSWEDTPYERQEAGRKIKKGQN